MTKSFLGVLAKGMGERNQDRRKQDIEAKRESEAQKRMRKAARRKRGNGRPQRYRKTELRRRGELMTKNHPKISIWFKKEGARSKRTPQGQRTGVG